MAVSNGDETSSGNPAHRQIFFILMALNLHVGVIGQIHLNIHAANAHRVSNHADLIAALQGEIRDQQITADTALGIGFIKIKHQATLTIDVHAHTADTEIIHQADIGRHFKYVRDRKSTRLNSSHVKISYAVFCLKKKTHKITE